MMLAFPIQGIPEGYDVAQHLRFAVAYQDAILNGSFIPVWPLTDNLGFGSVGIRFYPPFADVVLAVTQIFTGDWYRTLEIDSFLWMFPGSIGIYFWVKEFRPPMHAALAATLYAVMPYHILQIYQFQLYSEFVASAILPFCFLFATKIIKRDNTVDIWSLAVSCSLLILTHIPTSIIGFGCLGLYVSLIINWKSPLKKLGRFALSMALALASSSFYILRVVTEVAQLKHNTAEYSTGFYDYRLHFFPVLYNYGENYWLLFLWVLDLSILVTLLVYIPLTFSLIRLKNFSVANKVERKMLVAVFVTGLFSLFMLTNGSEFVWSTVTVLQKIQFPWRFMTVATLMGAVSLSLAISLLLGRFGRLSRLIVYPTIAFIICLVLFDLTQIILMGAPLSRDKYYEKVVNKLHEEGCTCWWPVWAEKNALENKERVTAGNRTVQIEVWVNETREFKVSKGEPANIRVGMFYYPNWKATVNDQAAEVQMDENGVILIPVSGAASTVRLFFEEPFIYRVAIWFSSSTWVLLFFAILACKRKLFLSEQLRLGLWRQRTDPLA